jgi:exodeoxyribonuclease V beta subunit
VSEPAEFDVFNYELEGVNLIEASAGTGKTWNICGLYLRLLLERGLEVQKILVVTFTKAATAELRERVRAGIVETLATLRQADPATAGADPFPRKLVQAVEQRSRVPRTQLVRLLEQALEFFDEAAIFTTHGFCQRALAEASFSAALSFSLEPVTDDREMVLESVRDFWRRRIADGSCPPALAAYLLEKRDTPEKYAQLLARSLSKPLARCLWPEGIDRAAAIDPGELTRAYEAARNTWIGQRASIVDAIRRSPAALNANVYNRKSVEQAAGQWDAWFKEGRPLASPPEADKLKLLSSDWLRERTNNRQTTPTHAFFDQAGALLAAREAMTQKLDVARLRLVRELIDTAGPELRQRKRERRLISFDDMLHNLYAALESGEHPELASSLRQKFPVALVDEFQDTDPLQFAIFDRIYGRGEAPLFLVGDPKQAIYSFRNADLQAYLRGRRSAGAQFTLAQNQRSTGGLIEALNGLFSATRDAFMLPGLPYHPVNMGEKLRPALRDASSERPDLQAWLLPPAPDGRPIDKQTAQTLALQATAAEIARLITEAGGGRIAIGDRPLKPGDIAALVRTHAQGSTLKRELAQLNIASVELTQASVFQSPEAEEVERVLMAINQPARESLLRGALASELIGCDAAKIAQISSHEDLFIGYLTRFAEYRDLWLRQGVGIMYRRLLTQEQVSARMLRGPDGERRLTNLLHLGELVHQAAATHDSPDALLRWLQTQRREGSADDVAQLRLESDRNLVQIITIHKAKGLEFPIVFCPFLWDGGTRSGGPRPEGREYHDADGTAVIDFRLKEEIGAEELRIKAQIELEASSESLRLIYVALTRAVHRCYLIAGTYTTNRFGNISAQESTKSLLNWLVCGGQESPQTWLKATRSPDDIDAAWKALAARLRPHLGLAPLPSQAGTPVVLAGPAPETLMALAPPASIAPAWQLSSFSGLTLDAKIEAAAIDHDARAALAARRIAAPGPQIALDDILRFPRGARAGDCLHAVFERIDFTDPGGWSEAIAQALVAHPQFLAGARAAEQSALLAAMAARMLQDVLSTALPGGIVLGSIPLSRRLVELEFNLPAPRVSASALNAALHHLGYDVPRLGFRDLQGYLKGFIDLVFEHDGRYYLLDWKSNHLGYQPSDYGPEPLKAAMSEHAYHLQYLLYTVAVDRYLQHRVPGYRYHTHFGGALYLFVRGVRPDWVDSDGRAAGVFHHRPGAATLAQLAALLAPWPEKELA